METFSALLAICAGNSPVTGEFPAPRQMTRSFDVFFDLHLNNRLSKQARGWWFETPLHPLWRHYNVIHTSWSLLLDVCYCYLHHFAIVEHLMLRNSHTSLNKHYTKRVDNFQEGNMRYVTRLPFWKSTGISGGSFWKSTVGNKYKLRNCYFNSYET